MPLRKIAQPTDVARAAAFLASHRAAGHISGQCISVDGGMVGSAHIRSACGTYSDSGFRKVESYGRRMRLKSLNKRQSRLQHRRQAFQVKSLALPPREYQYPTTASHLRPSNQPFHQSHLQPDPRSKFSSLLILTQCPAGWAQANIQTIILRITALDSSRHMLVFHDSSNSLKNWAFRTK